MEQSNAMIYKVSWTEVVNYSIVVDAKTEEEAREAVMFGQFDNDDVCENECWDPKSITVEKIDQ